MNDNVQCQYDVFIYCEINPVHHSLIHPGYLAIMTRLLYISLLITRLKGKKKNRHQFDTKHWFTNKAIKKSPPRCFLIEYRIPSDRILYCWNKFIWFDPGQLNFSRLNILQLALSRSSLIVHFTHSADPTSNSTSCLHWNTYILTICSCINLSLSIYIKSYKL